MKLFLSILLSSVVALAAILYFSLGKVESQPCPVMVQGNLLRHVTSEPPVARAMPAFVPNAARLPVAKSIETERDPFQPAIKALEQAKAELRPVLKGSGLVVKNCACLEGSKCSCGGNCKCVIAKAKSATAKSGCNCLETDVCTCGDACRCETPRAKPAKANTDLKKYPLSDRVGVRESSGPISQGRLRDDDNRLACNGPPPPGMFADPQPCGQVYQYQPPPMMPPVMGGCQGGMPMYQPPIMGGCQGGMPQYQPPMMMGCQGSYPQYQPMPQYQPPPMYYAPPQQQYQPPAPSYQPAPYGGNTTVYYYQAPAYAPAYSAGRAAPYVFPALHPFAPARAAAFPGGYAAGRMAATAACGPGG
ncbi:MAG TPA: hypothetical protein VGZ25_07390 [Gemmataceae bacterium]|nr:hypothetical protein [Gemmataceae bacterium]